MSRRRQRHDAPVEENYHHDDLRPRKRRNALAHEQSGPVETTEPTFTGPVVNTPLDQCLNHCLQLFPHIDTQHVHKLCKDLHGSVEAVIEDIAQSDNYPKQSKTIRLAQAETEHDFAKPGRPPVSSAQRFAIRKVLSLEFPSIPSKYIDQQRKKTQYLFHTYHALDEALRQQRRPFRNRASQYYDKPPPAKHEITSSTHWLAAYFGHVDGALEILSELDAARLHCQQQQTDRDNLMLAKKTNALAECAVCYDQHPLNRMIYCDGEQLHFTCFDCIKEYLKSQIGDARVAFACPHGEGGVMCEAQYSQDQLKLVPDVKLINKLQSLQQQCALREADLQGIAECPFCDYKAIYPPVQEDSEFRCDNDACQKVSCRRCNKETHIPLSCAEHAANIGIDRRHAIEEARTAALLRICNKCKKSFVKTDGCNRTDCSCGNSQCYTCGKDANNGYAHFDRGGGCKIYDEVSLDARHHDEVEAAEQDALARVLAEHPDVAADALTIKFAADLAARPEPRPVRYGLEQNARWQQRAPRVPVVAHGRRRPAHRAVVPQAPPAADVARPGLVAALGAAIYDYGRRMPFGPRPAVGRADEQQPQQRPAGQVQ